MKTRGKSSGGTERKKRRNSTVDVVAKCPTLSNIKPINTNIINTAIDDCKENVPPGEENQIKKKRKTNKKQKWKGLSLDSGRVELLANNKELATALEEAQIKINRHSVANVELKRQLYHERQIYIESLNREVNKQMKDRWSKVLTILQNATEKFMEGTKLVGTVHDMFDAEAASKTNTPMSYSVGHLSSIHITPPLDEPCRRGDVTALDEVSMETTTVTQGVIDSYVPGDHINAGTSIFQALGDHLNTVTAGDNSQQNRSDDYDLMGIDMNKSVSVADDDDDDAIIMSELSFMDTGYHDPITASEAPKRDEHTAWSLGVTESGLLSSNSKAILSPASDRPARTTLDDRMLTTPASFESTRVRRRTPNVSYTMPSLRSKLRRGDPYTDSTLYQAHPQTQKRRGKLSTCSMRKRQRSALSNISNIIISEEV